MMKLSAILCTVITTGLLVVLPVQGFPFDRDELPWAAASRRSKSLDDSVCDTLEGKERGRCRACFNKAEKDLWFATMLCGDNSDDDCHKNAMEQHGQKTLQCSRHFLFLADSWAPPGESDQRGPCPFINTSANHGVINRDGKFIDLLDMALRMEALYNIHRDFLNGGPVQLAIDCGQTYTDDDGIIRIDLEALFEPQCEEHEASMVRADKFFGFEESKLVDETLLDSLVAVNPTSPFLTKEDVMEYQISRIMDSGDNTGDTLFRKAFDYDNMGAQGVFLFLVSDDPLLETVDKNVLHNFLRFEKLPDDFVPGSLRETPFNFLDPDDFSRERFEESKQNAQDAIESDYSDLVV